MSNLAGLFAPVPALLASHLLVAAAALLLALLIALPLAVFARDRPRLRGLAVGFASLIQTIPGLALLALFYPLLRAASALLGGRVPALGFLPALLALTLYALLPILRNTIAGLTGIEPAVIEAADGVGMTRRQRLRLIEAPLAAPVAMAGIRTAAVWTIGAATLATTIGYPTLGNLIFAGLQTENMPLVLAGCIAAAALAIVADALLGLVERGIATQRRALVIAPGIAILVGLALALVPMLWPGRAAITIGAKNFSEQYILARLIGARLEAAGYRVRYREGLGSAVLLSALEAGDIDIAVDYGGTIWANAMHRTDTPPARAMDAAIDRWLAAQWGARALGALGFENAYALAVRADAGIADLAALSAASPRLALGSDLEFLDRPEWRALRDAYALHFRETRAFSPTFMYRALASGQVDAISAFSSDGRIAANKLVVLADPKHAAPAYDALLLTSRQAAHDPRLVGALRPLIGRIGVGPMRAANYMVDRDAGKATPEAAAQWLAARIR